MKLVRLLYYSRASREISLADLKDVLDTARSNNGNLNICGMLCYDKQYFLQALEGEQKALNELYLDIADDARHDEVVIISYDEVTQPSFPQWKMGYAASSTQFATLLKELGQKDFAPADMNPKQALTFLQKMSKFQSEV
ncbi:MAG: BLUF domain-containing protein [Paraglaciecola sp.]|uniref:BLUF domain-containing protein n=1 Tax=Paraglaciecola sp. TaxID=1920173 RepID=UPI003296A4D4